MVGSNQRTAVVARIRVVCAVRPLIFDDDERVLVGRLNGQVHHLILLSVNQPSLLDAPVSCAHTHNLINCGRIALFIIYTTNFSSVVTSDTVYDGR